MLGGIYGSCRSAGDSNTVWEGQHLTGSKQYLHSHFINLNKTYQFNYNAKY